MSEPFVKEIDGVLKIHEFEKHYIADLLKDKISEVEAQYERLKLSPLSIYLRDLKAVLERVEAMPSARW